MILLDTNILSESMRPRPDPVAKSWLDAQPWETLYSCTPVLAELRYGVERLAAGRRKTFLSEVVDRIENEIYRGRILSFDPVATRHYGRLMVKREQQGHRLEQMDGLIAAIALTHGAIVATRDAGDFAGLGLEVINPFDSR
jgi:predicted nucleic acid-binding protein